MTNENKNNVVKIEIEFRPTTEPGCYWWEDKYCNEHIVEFDEGMDIVGYHINESQREPIQNFEAQSDFKRWLGKAVSPGRHEALIKSIKEELEGACCPDNCIMACDSIEETINKFEEENNG